MSKFELAHQKLEDKIKKQGVARKNQSSAALV